MIVFGMQMRALPSLRMLRILDAAARHESLTRAADELGLTQSAVSKQIALLEDRLGAVVFERHHRRVILTPLGRRLAWIAEQTLSDLAGRIDAAMTAPDATVRVVADADVAQLWLFPKLPDFYRQHPDITVSITSESALSGPPDGAYDCAILWGRGEWRTCRFQMLMTNTVFPVARPGFFADADPRAAFDATPARQFIHDRTPQWWQTVLASVGSVVDVEAGPTYSATALCLDAAVRGDGATVGDEISTRHHLESGTLEAPFPIRFPSPEAYYVVEPLAREASDQTHAFIAWLYQQADAHRRWFDVFWRSKRPVTP